MKNLTTKLSYALYTLLACAFLISCGIGTTQDPLECKTSVSNEFPNAIEIKSPTGEKFRWLVLDADSTLWYVETMNNFNTNVSGKERVFDFSNAR